MMRVIAASLLLLLPVLPPLSAANALDIDGLPDQFGNKFLLSSWGEDRLAVVAFLGVDCPLGSLYANRLNELHARYANRGVCFIAINSDHHDSYEEMREFAKQLNFPMLKDQGNVVADQFGANYSPEVFLLDAARDVIYQGRIDDQYEPGIHTRTSPSRNDLEEAITEALEWKPISVPVTRPSGCRIDRERNEPTQPPANDSVTYSEIAPIFDAKCAGCHRPGEVAPFSLLSHDDALAWSGTIRDVVEQKRMPPWSATSSLHLANDLSLSDQERSRILAWIDAGLPEGNPGERPAPPAFVQGWKFTPDVVLSMAEPFTVPKEGLLDYQEFIIDPGFTTEKWVDAIEIRPGNNKVVHHATVYLKPKNAEPGMFYYDQTLDNYLALYVPGNSATTLPAGTAKRIPAGFNLHLSIHYVPNGKSQTDLTTVGLRFAVDPIVQVATRLNANEIALDPGETKTIAAELTMESDCFLFALYPHMHLRGRSMRFEARFPDGRVQTLLDVPQYDFEWQHRYVLETPLVLPAGTLLRCIGVYDNSSANPRNPNPNAYVKDGELTTDEMFFGAFEVGRLIPPRKGPTAGLAAMTLVCMIWVMNNKLKTKGT